MISLALGSMGALSAGCATTVQPAQNATVCPDPLSANPHPTSHSILFSRYVGQTTGTSTWLVDPDGKNVRQLAGSSSGDTSPIWSPDGTRIAFARDAGGARQIYEIGSDSKDLRRLTCGYNDTHATWSPDGAHLLFTEEDRSGLPDSVYTMNADGTGTKLVLHSQSEYFHDISWSPDGQWVAAQRMTGNTSGIWLFKPDGSQLHSITQRGDGTDASPAWSPDGHWIAFGRENINGQPRSVWLVKPDKSGLHQLVQGSFDYPTWSPDGTRLAFIGGGANHWAIYTASSTGTGLRMLAGPFAETIFTLNWSPAR